MTDEGYKPVFDRALEVSKMLDYSTTFPNFHNNQDLFHFIMAPYHQWGPDEGALEQAQKTNAVAFQEISDKGPSRVGNGPDVLDHVESRHILLMTNLVNLLGTSWGNVVEIGGGYGNQLRLISGIVDYNSWAIIDMDYILELQKWFLMQTHVNLRKVHFLDSKEVSITPAANLVIGTHSLSEFSLDNFDMYYVNVIRDAKWFYYASHVNKPDATLLATKLKTIEGDFNIYDETPYEGGSSIMYLFRNKND